MLALKSDTDVLAQVVIQEFGNITVVLIPDDSCVQSQQERSACDNQTTSNDDKINGNLSSRPNALSPAVAECYATLVKNYDDAQKREVDEFHCYTLTSRAKSTNEDNEPNIKCANEDISEKLKIECVDTDKPVSTVLTPTLTIENIDVDSTGSGTVPSSDLSRGTIYASIDAATTQASGNTLDLDMYSTLPDTENEADCCKANDTIKSTQANTYKLKSSLTCKAGRPSAIPLVGNRPNTEEDASSDYSELNEYGDTTRKPLSTRNYKFRVCIGVISGVIVIICIVTVLSLLLMAQSLRPNNKQRGNASAAADILGVGLWNNVSENPAPSKASPRHQEPLRRVTDKRIERLRLVALDGGKNCNINTMALLPDEQQLLLACEEGNSFSIYNVNNTNSFSLLPSVQVQGKPVDAMWTRKGQIVYADRADQTVKLINPRTRKVIATESFFEPMYVSLSASDDVIYLADGFTGVYRSSDSEKWIQVYRKLNKQFDPCQAFKLPINGTEGLWIVEVEKKKTSVISRVFKLGDDGLVNAQTVLYTMPLPKRINYISLHTSLCRLTCDSHGNVYFPNSVDRQVLVWSSADYPTGDWKIIVKSSDMDTPVIAAWPRRLAVDSRRGLLYIGHGLRSLSIFRLTFS